MSVAPQPRSAKTRIVGKFYLSSLLKLQNIPSMINNSTSPHSLPPQMILKQSKTACKVSRSVPKPQNSANMEQCCGRVPHILDVQPLALQVAVHSQTSAALFIRLNQSSFCADKRLRMYVFFEWLLDQCDIHNASAFAYCQTCGTILQVLCLVWGQMERNQRRHTSSS